MVDALTGSVQISVCEISSKVLLFFTIFFLPLVFCVSTEFAFTISMVLLLALFLYIFLKNCFRKGLLPEVQEER